MRAICNSREVKQLKISSVKSMTCWGLALSFRRRSSRLPPRWPFSRFLTGCNLQQPPTRALQIAEEKWPLLEHDPRSCWTVRLEMLAAGWWASAVSSLLWPGWLSYVLIIFSLHTLLQVANSRQWIRAHQVFPSITFWNEPQGFGIFGVWHDATQHFQHYFSFQCFRLPLAIRHFFHPESHHCLCHQHFLRSSSVVQNDNIPLTLTKQYTTCV